jgi:hypothetical protein
MAKWRHRECKCGKVDFTASKSDVCKECFLAQAKTEKIAEERAHLLAVYGNVEGPEIGDFGKRCYTFVHTCGTEQTWRFDNLLKQFKTKPDPCSKCGGTERMKPAMAAYVAKYGLDEKQHLEFRAYSRRVRGISDKAYRDNIHTINPLRLKRQLGNKGFHLDHKTPIIRCFLDGWPAEKAGALDNLQMLSASANLTKGRGSKAA